MNIKLTGKEKRWIMYDVGNSAFALLVSTIIPIYFNYLAGKAEISSVNYLAYWDMLHQYVQSLLHYLVLCVEHLQILKASKNQFFLYQYLLAVLPVQCLGHVFNGSYFLLCLL